MPARRLPWFKMWIGATAHGKVRQLDDGAFRTWVELLDAASQQPKRGRFDSRREAVAITRRPAKHVASIIAAGLMDERDDGLWMHDWEDWQRWRPEDANDTPTTTDHPPNGRTIDTRTTTESLPNDPVLRARVAREEDVEEEVRVKSKTKTLPPAPTERPPTRVGKPKIRAPISLETIERLVLEYAPQFGDEVLVRDWIARALNHTARLKALDETLYVERTWLKPELAKLKALAEPFGQGPGSPGELPGLPIAERKFATCSMCSRRGRLEVGETPLCDGCKDRSARALHVEAA